MIAAISGRALAQAAHRAGYRVRVADFFGDNDTRVVAEQIVSLPGDLKNGIDGGQVAGALHSLMQEEYRSAELAEAALAPANGHVFDHVDVADALILGSGFERMPDLVDQLALSFPYAGCSGEAIRRVKNPQWLASTCAELDIKHPEICFDAPVDTRGWVTKVAGGAGGGHVQPAKKNAALRGGHYFQRFVTGRNVSALFLADGRRARIVGFSRQWTSPIAGARYRYGGAVRLTRFDPQLAAKAEGSLSRLSARAGLRGLCSADFRQHEGGMTLIEINPRPGATLDIFDSADAPLVEAHVRASRGEAFELPQVTDSMAAMIVYAASPIKKFPAIAWPDWTADRQTAGTSLAAGDPVCTVFGWGKNETAAKACVQERVRQLNWAWGKERS